MTQDFSQLTYEEINQLPYWVVENSSMAWLHAENPKFKEIEFEEIPTLWEDDALNPQWASPPPTLAERKIRDVTGGVPVQQWEAPPSCDWPR